MTFSANFPPNIQTAVSTTTHSPRTDREVVDLLMSSRARIEAQLRNAVVGQNEVVEQTLIALFAGGHCLLTGAPGLAKTLLVNSIARIFDLKFQRIQFTPDLMPADITGTEILQEDSDGRRMTFIQGPIFANMVLADEINRTPPKTQAALLEAMQEHQVTTAGVQRPLPNPFFVLATQNPIEMEGAYPLPEAQLDRFLFNVVIDYLPESDEVEVIKRTTSGARVSLEPVFTGDDVLEFNRVIRTVPVSDDWIRAAVKLSAASRPGSANAPDFVNEWVNWGAGTRAAQALTLGAKARALLHDRFHVSKEDLVALAKPTLRHRILVNYKAEAECVSPDTIIDRLVEHTLEDVSLKA